MMSTHGFHAVFAFLFCWLVTAGSSASGQEPVADAAAAILETSGVSGGLVVHLGCGDGQLTQALRKSDAFLVHGLDRDAENISIARTAALAEGTHGPVHFAQLRSDRLPYIDNAVNLLVADDLGSVPMAEVMRVLVPNGVLLTRAGEKWKTTIKPRPAELDEWTHYLHDASNNAVAHDTAIGPLRHLQWDGSPRYSRHHEYTTSVSAVVSAGGRMFSIMDMGSRASIHLPPQWQLTARDAFNGIVLWDQPIDTWFNHLWPLKDGPAQVARRLVAVGDSVYVTLGIDAPVSRLDAATGIEELVFPNTEFAQEILVSDGTLFVLRDDQSMNPKGYRPKLMVCWDEKNRTGVEAEGYLLKPDSRTIVALDPNTGETLWTAEQPVEPLTLAADEQGVYFHNWNRVVCLDRKTGQQRWISRPAALRDSMGLEYGPTLVTYGDVVLFADGRRERKIRAFDKLDGTLLWEAPHYAAGHAGSPEDLLVADGLVWCGKIAGGKDSGVFTGRDPNTGEIVREFLPDVDTYWFHHRCYRSKATDQYILTSRTGIEFVDINEKTWETHHWVRGACSYGIVPCNGLIYAPPHPCACYLDAKLSGLCALAPATQRTYDTTDADQDRLAKGPAYKSPSSLPLTPSSLPLTSWPTYRHDAARSGATEAEVGSSLTQQWSVELGQQLTSPVVADGRVYVADQQNHTVYAVNAQDGDTAWTYTADGRVDSPPTIYRNLVIFGSADGHVYCLRADDGTLVWRFRAAPVDMRLVSYGHLESVWPVHGSVLVQEGVATCVAGRSTYLDGGLRIYRLDAVTGKVLSEQVLNDQQSPQKDVKILNMPTALPDILSSDGQHLYMRSQTLDLLGNRIQTVAADIDPVDRATQQVGEGAHLFSPTGWLDDEAWHRSYWLYGRTFAAGCNWWYRNGRYAPAGRMLVFDTDRVYGFGREQGLFVWSHVLENHLFSSARQADPESIDRVKQWSKRTGRDVVFNRSVSRSADARDRSAPELYWSVMHPPLHVRSLVLAGDMLLAAGPPDLLDEDAAYTRPDDPEVVAQIQEQEAANHGQRGALFLGVAKETGETLFQRELPAPPVWDGMAVVAGRVFICTTDGRLTCLGSE